MIPGGGARGGTRSDTWGNTRRWGQGVIPRGEAVGVIPGGGARGGTRSDTWVNNARG